jgi:selenocysteine lyase/cysteine desulfurase
VYKFFGPHVGAVYGRRSITATLPTYKVRPAEHRFETGTGNFEGDAGAAAAVEYLADIGRRYGGAAQGSTRREALQAGMRAIRAYEMDLHRHLASKLSAIDGVRILGLTAEEDMERRTPTLAITVAGVSPRTVAERLGERGIAVWDGDFYATGLIERLGLAPEGVVRIGLTHYNTRAEIDRLAVELAEIAEIAAA